MRGFAGERVTPDTLSLLLAPLEARHWAGRMTGATRRGAACVLVLTASTDVQCTLQAHFPAGSPGQTGPGAPLRAERPGRMLACAGGLLDIHGHPGVGRAGLFFKLFLITPGFEVQRKATLNVPVF